MKTARVTTYSDVVDTIPAYLGRLASVWVCCAGPRLKVAADSLFSTPPRYALVARATPKFPTSACTSSVERVVGALAVVRVRSVDETVQEQRSETMTVNHWARTVGARPGECTPPAVRARDRDTISMPAEVHVRGLFMRWARCAPGDHLGVLEEIVMVS